MLQIFLFIKISFFRQMLLYSAIVIIATLAVVLLNTNAFQNEELYQIRESWLPHVRTSKGLLQGSTVVTERGNTGFAFQGVPFIEPPIGSLRFLPPVRKTAWSGTYLADKYPRVCPQNPQFSNLSIEIQSEDCVYLMIYTPAVDFSSLKNDSSPNFPVMYYIHGGDFVFDSPAMFPLDLFVDHFTTKGVIFVMVAYRLGPFGFWTMGTDDENQGNMAIKDIVKGLEWVQDEIGSFGGDPNRVTLMGHSSGGGAVSLLSMLPATKGLFNQLIVMSGGDIDYEPADKAASHRQLSDALGCNPTNESGAASSNDSVWACMQKIDARTIIETSQDIGLIMLPRIDGQLIPSDPDTLRKSRRKMSAIFGTTTEEFADIAKLFGPDKITIDFVRFLCRFMATAAAPNAAAAAIQACNQFYVDRFNGKVASNDSIFWAHQLNILTSHSAFESTRSEALDLGKTGGNVGIYQFSYTKNGFEGIGPYHSMDLIFLFGLHPLPTNTDADKRIGDIQAVLFTNFAKTGNPTPVEPPYVSGNITPVVPASLPTWTQLDFPDGYNYYDINIRPSMNNYYHFDEIQLWTVVIPMLEKFAVSSKPVDSSNTNTKLQSSARIARQDRHKLLASLGQLSKDDFVRIGDIFAVGESAVAAQKVMELLSQTIGNSASEVIDSASRHSIISGSPIATIAFFIASAVLIAATAVVILIKRSQRKYQYRSIT